MPGMFYKLTAPPNPASYPCLSFGSPGSDINEHLSCQHILPETSQTFSHMKYGVSLFQLRKSGAWRSPFFHSFPPNLSPSLLQRQLGAILTPGTLSVATGVEGSMMWLVGFTTFSDPKTQIKKKKKNCTQNSTKPKQWESPSD